MNELLSAISQWPPNRWLMGGGMLGVLFFGSTGVGGITPNPGTAMFATGMSAVFVVLGAWYAREAARFQAEERRKNKRPDVPVSELSLDFALQISEPVSIETADDLPDLENDKKKTKEQLLKTIKRLRLREAAHHGQVIYYQQGMYHPRPSDATVIG